MISSGRDSIKISLLGQEKGSGFILNEVGSFQRVLSRMEMIRFAFQKDLSGGGRKGEMRGKWDWAR